MQQFLLHKRVYQVNKIDETEYSKKVYERLEKIKLFELSDFSIEGSCGKVALKV